MMILDLSSKCAISATPLLPLSISYCLHKMYLLKSTKKIMVNLVKISEFDYSILVIYANNFFFRILTTTFQRAPLVSYTTVGLILYAHFERFRGALYYMYVM